MVCAGELVVADLEAQSPEDVWAVVLVPHLTVARERHCLVCCSNGCAFGVTVTVTGAGAGAVVSTIVWYQKDVFAGYEVC